MSSVSGRILALDLGKRRIGLAVSDELGLTAQGLPTLVRKNKLHDLEVLSRVVSEYQVGRVVVGNPIQLSGDAGRQSQEAERFAATLARHLGIEVTLWDERLTTVEAGRILRESGVGLDKRKAAVDRLSAVLILQSYLDYLAARDETGTSTSTSTRACCASPAASSPPIA